MTGLDLHVELGTRRLRAGLERELRDAVRTGRLTPGTRLPSSRTLAADLGVARNTVAHAYALLVAEGWFEAHRGRGTAVAHDVPAPSPAADPAATPSPQFDLRPGVPDVAGFPREAWAAAYRRALLAATPDDLAYGDPQGHPRLRAALASYLGRARGVRTDAGRIVVCHGASHGLGLLAVTLARLGHDQVAMESYCFPLNHRVSAGQGLGATPLPLDDEGARVDRLRSTGAGAVVLTPAHQFPTGVPLSARRRAAVLAWARDVGGVVVEDDYDGEFRYDGTRVGALQAGDPERVVYLGSLSKALAPGLRLGWLAAPRTMVEPLVRARQDGDLHPGVVEQLALAEFLENGGFDRHLREARLRYRRRRRRLEQHLAAAAPAGIRGVAAGLHALVDLPGGRAAEAAVVARAAEQGLAVTGLGRFLVPGAEDGGRAGLVVGYARPPAHAFRGALAALAAILPG